MIDFDWYRSFVAIYRAGSLTRAAEARLMTQPAMSQHLAGLEGTVGARLFERQPRRVVPTAAGKELYARIAESVDHLEHVAHTLPTSAQERELVRLGTPQEFFFEEGLGRIAGSPQRWWVTYGETTTLLTSLERGDLDLVIATQRIPRPTLDLTKLFDEEFVVVGPAGAAVTPGVDAAGAERWLQGQDWVAYGTDLPIIRRFWHQAFGRRPTIQPVLVVPDLRSVVRAVESGLGVSVVPRYLCADALGAGRTALLWDPDPPVVNELWLASRRVDRASPLIEQARLALLR